MGETLLYIEIDFIGIMILTLIFFVRKHSGVQAHDQMIFDYILAFLSINLLLDALIWGFNGREGGLYFALNQLCSVIYNIVEPIVGLYWLTYCYYRVFKDYKNINKFFVLFSIPVIFNGMLSIGSLYSNWIFYISDDNIYTRGELFYINAIVNFLYIGVAAGISLYGASKEKNSYRKRELYYMALFLLPPALGGICQVAFYGINLIWICTVISLLMVYLHVQSHAISMDTLTGTNNRWQLNRYLDSKLTHITPEMTLFAFMIDMDGFKKINDTFGHATGDEALIITADLLKEACVGTRDFLARQGGDEFVMICERTSYEEASAARDKILNLFEKYNYKSGLQYILRPSIGIGEYLPGMSADALLKTADAAMYEIKQKKQL